MADPVDMGKIGNALMAGADECAYDQPCAYGFRVGGHAVYCEHPLPEMPRKCRRTWYTGGRERDEDCPGFKAREVTHG